MSDIEPPEQARQDRHAERARRMQTIRLVIVVALATAFVAVALDNTQDVAIGWVVNEASVPLVVALLLSFAVGTIVGAYAAWRRRSRQSD